MKTGTAAFEAQLIEDGLPVDLAQMEISELAVFRRIPAAAGA